MASDRLVPVEQLEDMLHEFGDRALDSLEDQAMQRLLNTLEAQAVELAPVDLGNLEASTSTRVDSVGGKDITGTLRFNTPYAAHVHELPDDSRGPRTRLKPGNELGAAGPKYLERPLRMMQQRMAGDVGEFLTELWGAAARRTGGRGRR